MGLFQQVAEQQKSGGVFSQASQEQNIKVGGVPLSLGQKVKNFATEALPTIGAIGGGIAGGIAGGAVASPTVLGIPAGAYAGGVTGATAGAAGGEALKEKIQGQDLQPSQIAKTGAEYGALEAIGGPVASFAGKVIKATGAGLAKMFIPKSEAEAGLLQTYKASEPFLQRVGAVLGYGEKKAPATAASTAFEKGLLGTETMIGVQAKRAQSKLWDKIVSPALKQSKETINMPTFFNEAEQKIVAETPDLTRRKVLLEALNSIKKDYKGVKNISLEQLQKFKEGWAEFVPQGAYKGKPIPAALGDIRNTLAKNARTKIYDALGDNVKQAYLDYGNLHGITAIGRQAMTGVTGVIKGGTGTSIKNILEHVTIPIGTLGGQTIYKVGQGIEILGLPGARTVRDALGIPLGFNDNSNPDQSSTEKPPQQ